MSNKWQIGSMGVQWNDKLDRPPLCYLWNINEFKCLTCLSLLVPLISICPVFVPLDLWPPFFPQSCTTMRNNGELLQTASLSLCSVSISVSNTWHFLASLFLSLSRHHILISLSLHPFPFIFTSFVVLHPTLHFQMWSLPVLISCYFPQSSCSSSISHFLLSIPHSF